MNRQLAPVFPSDRIDVRSFQARDVRGRLSHSLEVCKVVRREFRLRFRPRSPLGIASHLHDLLAFASKQKSATSTISTLLCCSSVTSRIRRNRSAGRNVHLYKVNNSTEVLGGLVLTNGITNTNFYSMVEILLIFTSTFFLRDERNTPIPKDSNSLQPGNYYIVTTGELLHY